MPLDEGETLSRAVQQLRRACGDAASATAELGTARDTMAREKLRRSRLLVTQCEEKASGIIASGVDAELVALRGHYNAARADFDRVNKEAIRREKQTWRPTSQADSVEGDRRGAVGASLLAQNPGRVQEIRAVDMSGLHTEEALQREKLLGVREIEANMTDLHTMYHEFHDLVHHQQTNLDSMTENVSGAKTSVEGGRKELAVSSRRQKCGRKMLCAIAAVLLIVIIVVVVVVLLVKR
ncbi:syntaxin 7 [Trypanosoma conorhini]|uniref:Syntaxin 7 n=1 Tax=Trypanosoma conorhini TaxID=83891 RepID=A0A422PMU5_9TRYP|nr:syntaxin 7 [Trypanosoma conorhini]RNF19023.1 syntaxin 7 [Trypanosoma conorhini]